MGTSSDEENDGDWAATPPPKKKLKQKHRDQKYRKAWEENKADLGSEVAAWLAPDPKDATKAICKWCSTSLQATITVLKKHKDSQKHLLKRTARGETSSNLITKFVVAEPTQPALLTKKIQAAEIKLSGCFAAHGVSIQFIDHLLPILKSCDPNSDVFRGLQMKRMKCTKIITNVIGAAHKDELAEMLKEVKFSILVDESTHFNNKTSAIAVRFFDKSSGRIVSRLFDLSDVFPKGEYDIAHAGATGARLFAMIIESLEQKNVPLKNLIGFASDNASVMIGQDNSVFSRLESACPGIILMRCICHSLHLAAKDACKSLPRTCEDLARNLYTFFKHSNKRAVQLQEFQEFLDIASHQLLRLSLTRWLCLKENVDRILEQWEALRLFITGAYIEDHTKGAEQLNAWLNDPFIKLYYQFLAWILRKVTDMNQFFQSAKVVVTSLHKRMSDSFKDILQAYMDPEYIRRTALSDIQPDRQDKFKPICNLYLGVHVMEAMKKPQIEQYPDTIKAFRENCLQYLVKLCCGIKSRYNFGDPLLESISALKPENALAPNRTRIFAESIIPLCDLVPRAQPETADERQRLDDEWRTLAFDTIPDHIAKEKEVDVFWSKLAEISTDGMDDDDKQYKYVALPKFALSVLSLPHSNADIERCFSKVTNTKTKLRNRLITKNVEGICLASQCVRSSAKRSADFQPTADMFSRMTSKVLYDSAGNENEDDVIEEWEDFE